MLKLTDEQYKTGFYSQEGDAHNTAYCHKYFSGGLYLKGSGTALTNMDVDCDGRQEGLQFESPHDVSHVACS